MALSLLLTLVLTLGAVWLGWPAFQRYRAVVNLVSADAIAQDRAGQDLLGQKVLAAHPEMAQRIIARLARQQATSSPLPDSNFTFVTSVLRQTGQWSPEQAGSDLYLHDLEARSRTAPSAEAVLAVARQAGANLVPDKEDGDEWRLNDRVIPLWLGLMHHRAIADNTSDRLLILDLCEQSLTGHSLEQVAYDLTGDADSQLRRQAWVIMGLINPLHGYTLNWKEEKNISVREAMLWASVRTDPDDASVIISALDTQPWPVPIVPWLLSRSRDAEARRRLVALSNDGNPSADLPLAEMSREDSPRLTDAMRAWIGLGAVQRYAQHDEGDPALLRWFIWRRPDSVTPYDEALIHQVFDEPQASDGTVWATALLADRVFDPAACEDLMKTWRYKGGAIPVDQAPYVLASALLDGLKGQASSDEISKIRQGGRTEGPTGVLACFLAGDRRKAIDLLASPATFSPSRSPGPADDPSIWLIERAWLIERFTPEVYAMVAPISPWNRDVASLQKQIIRTALHLHERDTLTALHSPTGQ